MFEFQCIIMLSFYRVRCISNQNLSHIYLCRFTFTNKNNITVRIISYGATITDILMPDKNGAILDISLGFDTAAGKHVFYSLK